VIEALMEVKARKLAIVTPYIEEINKLEKRFMESIGFEVCTRRASG
jgi:maleate cis-trans isomerase